MSKDRAQTGIRETLYLRLQNPCMIHASFTYTPLPSCRALLQNKASISQRVIESLQQPNAFKKEQAQYPKFTSYIPHSWNFPPR